MILQMLHYGAEALLSVLVLAGATLVTSMAIDLVRSTYRAIHKD